MFLRARHEEGREGARAGGETEIEGGAFEEERTEAPKEGQTRKRVPDGEDELLRTRQRSLAHRTVVERRAVLLLHERQQQHVLVHTHDQCDAQFSLLRVHHGTRDVLQSEDR